MATVGDKDSCKVGPDCGPSDQVKTKPGAEDGTPKGAGLVCITPYNIKCEVEIENCNVPVKEEPIDIQEGLPQSKTLTNIKKEMESEADCDPLMDSSLQQQNRVKTEPGEEDRGEELRETQILEILEQSDYEEDERQPYASDNEEYFKDTDDSESEESSSEELNSPSISLNPSIERGRSHTGTRNRRFSRRGHGRIINAPGRNSNNQPLNQYTWTEIIFSKSIPILSLPYLKPDRTNFTKMDYFKQYFDEELIDMIVEKTNQSTVTRRGQSLQLTNEECKVFIGISMTMACVGYPLVRMYWILKWRIPIITENMSRNRFLEIRNSLKFVYDDEVTAVERNRDKLWKVRPLLDKIIIACNREVKEQHMSIDEMMIPFSGSYAIRQYCPGKPNPIGLKAFVLANPNGTVCDLLIYQGSNTYPEYDTTEFGQREKAVLKLTESLVPGHIVYFNRYFTSEKLVQELKKRGIESTGTLMKNRIPATAREKLASDKSLKRKGRGSSQVLVRSDEIMAITKWYDNKATFLLSSQFSNGESEICRRYNKKEKAYMHVNQPEVVKMYNKNMAGIDMADRQLAACPSRCRTKKWTNRFFSHMLDIAINNSWIQYKKDEEEKGTPRKDIVQLRSFKMELAQILIEENTAPHELAGFEENCDSVVRGKRKRCMPLPSKLRRTQGSAHMPEVAEKQQRCRLPNCDKKSTVRCISCNIFLCLTYKRNCFKLFHE